MSRLFKKVAEFFRSRTQVGVDKAGNRYFTRLEGFDGNYVKEKRWVIFKGEEDPTSIPVEWICWLNGQRKKAPTPQEQVELEARRERARLNIAKLKKEEVEKMNLKQSKGTGKVVGPELQSFIQQFPNATPDNKGNLSEDVADKSEEKVEENRFSEPAGSDSTFKPGIWQPPT